jgi:hypothetical protein
MGSRSAYRPDHGQREQRQAARGNVKKAQSEARSKRTISNLDSKTRSGAKAAARKRGASY